MPPITRPQLDAIPRALRILASQIQAPDDIPAQCLRDAAHHIETLTHAIHTTLMENLHLADGDTCTLHHLKQAIAFQLPENVETLATEGAGESPDEAAQPSSQK